MINKKIFICLISFFASITLAACDLSVNDTVQDVTSELHQETSKEDTKDLGISQVSEQKIGEEIALSNDFSGYVYVMSTKEKIELTRKTDFSLDNKTFKFVEKDSYHDFNIRYHDKTYFSVKQIKVESINSLKISSDYTGNILLVLREDSK